MGDDADSTLPDLQFRHGKKNLRSKRADVRYFMVVQINKILELDWNPIIDDNDVIDKILVCIRDVTRLRALEQEAAQKRQELDNTSMATPHVTGAVALLALLNPTATAAQSKAAILGKAVPTTA